MARKCKHCKTELPQLKQSDNLQKIGFCSIDHMAKHGLEKARLNQAKKAKQENMDRKRKFYDGDIKTRKAAAKKACHEYIRARDASDPCICCGRPLGAKYDAGHFLESGNNSFLRFNEDNIHAQSVYCNQYKGGDSDDYEGRLRLKIGDERVNYLLANKGGIVKRTAQDYKEIENYYKNKLSELTANKND